MGEERRRLLVLTSTFPATPGDGTPEFVLTLAQALSGSFDITVLAPRVRGAASDEQIGGLTIHRFAHFPRRWERLAQDAILPALRAQPWRVVEAVSLMGSFVVNALLVATRVRPDVVNAHWIIPGGIAAMVLRTVCRIPYVLTVHGADAYALNSWPLSWLKAAVVAGAAAVAPVSADIAARIGAHDAPVVPMGVDLDDIQARVGPRTPISGQLLFVGRLAEKKGVDVLLRAMIRVPEATLVVVGDGPDRPSLEDLARTLGIDDRVSFLGSQPREVVFTQLRTAHAVVIPSRTARDGDQDGTPVVLAEAVAAGVPVVVSRLGGLAEQIADGTTGRVVTPESVEELGEAIHQTIANPQLAADRAEAARLGLHNSLGLEAMTARYEALLSTVGRTG